MSAVISAMIYWARPAARRRVMIVESSMACLRKEAIEERKYVQA